MAHGSGNTRGPWEPSISFGALTSHVTFGARVSSEIAVFLFRHQLIPHEEPERFLIAAFQPGGPQAGPQPWVRSLQLVLVAPLHLLL